MSVGASVDCSGLSPPVHGVWGTGPQSCRSDGKLSDRTLCTFDCAAGYTASGTVTCRTGSSASTATCNPDPCTGIQAPTNGVLLGSCATGAMNSGAACNVQCNQPYQLADPTKNVLRCSAGQLIPALSSVSCVDTSPPQISCPTFEAVNVADRTSCATINPVDYIAPCPDASQCVSATDASAPPSVTASILSSRCFPVMTSTPFYHSLDFVATDATGNTASCSVQLYVWSMDCPVQASITTDAGNATALYSLPQPVFSGLRSVSNTVLVSGEGWSGKHPGDKVILPISSGYTLTYTSVPTPNNPQTVSCNTTVTIVDREPPSLSCPAIIIAAAPAKLADIPLGVSSSDNSGTSPTLTNQSSSLSLVAGTASVGIYTVDYTATEFGGLALRSTCTVPIHVWDITCPSSISLFMSTSPSGKLIIPELVVTDSTGFHGQRVAGRDVQVQVTISGESGSFAPWDAHFFQTIHTNYTLTYLASVNIPGAQPSTKSCTVLVQLVDDIAPTLTCPASEIRAAPVHITGATYRSTLVAADNSGQVTVTNSPENFTFGPGTHNMGFVAQENAGHRLSTTCTVPVHVWDLQCPSDMTSVDTDTGKNYATVTLPTPTVSGSTGSHTPQISITVPRLASPASPGDSVPLYQGSSQLSYSVSLPGLTGNSKSCTVQVIVSDTEPPVLSCPSEIVAKADTSTNVAAVKVSQLLSDGVLAYSDNSGAVRLSWKIGSGASNTDVNMLMTFALQSSVQYVTFTATELGGNHTTNDCVVPMYIWAVTCPPTATVNTSMGGVGDAVASLTVLPPSLQGSVVSSRMHFEAVLPHSPAPMTLDSTGVQSYVDITHNNFDIVHNGPTLALQHAELCST
jgi:hypothetical protein